MKKFEGTDLRKVKSQIKHILLASFICLCANAIAQVQEEINLDDDIPVQGSPGMGMLESHSTSSRHRAASYYEKDGKYGFIFPSSVQHEAIYDAIQSTSFGYIVKKGKLFGVTDQAGVVQGKIEFDSVGAPSYRNNYIVKKNGKYGTISITAKPILSIKYSMILNTDHPSVSFVADKNGATQMVFNADEKVFSPKIDNAELHGDLVILKSGGKFGVFKRKLIVPFEYDSIFVPQRGEDNYKKEAKDSRKVLKGTSFRSYGPNDCFTVQKNDKYGLLDSAGTIIYPAQNDAVYNSQLYGYYCVKKDNLYGIYFTRSRTKTRIEFEKVYADGVGYVMATKDKMGGAFDLEGNQVVPFEYDPLSLWQNGLGLRVSKNKKKGIISKNGVLIIPPVYDDVDPFWENPLQKFIKVQSGDKQGVVNQNNETIIPIQYKWIGEEKGFIKVVTVDKKFGLYDNNGKEVIPAIYRWITDSDTENSNLIILQKDSVSFNFLNRTNNKTIFADNVIAYGYVLDQNKLLNPFSQSHQKLLFVKNKIKKVGMLNEVTGSLDIPFIYDEIIQHFETGEHTYFSVRKGTKFGIIDEKNRISIPLIYDAIRVDFVESNFEDESEASYTIVAAKGKKYGTVNLKNQVQVPFQYDDLYRISVSGLYKAKVGNSFSVINSKNEVINKGPFDEVSNFEEVGGRRISLQALSFYKGRMRVLDEKGNFLTSEVSMLPHKGYETFDELKWALVHALDGPDEKELKDFSNKITPSPHILYFLKANVFNKQPLTGIDLSFVKEKYYNDLQKVKLGWNSKHGYNRASLTQIADYTISERSYVTNTRREDQAFGDTRFMEKLLRNAVKVNGFWISSYFMSRQFESLEP